MIPTDGGMEREGCATYPSVLIVDDDPDFVGFLNEYLVGQGFRVEIAHRASVGMDKFREFGHDIVIADINLPDSDGMQLAEKIFEQDPDTIVFIVTGLATIESSLLADGIGVEDYLVKPVSLHRLDFIIKKAIEKRRLRKEKAELKFAAGQSSKYGELLGQSEVMHRVFSEIVKASKTHDTVLIHGETGTGKELAARAIHDLGNRRNRPFIAINCSSIAESLLESELFGHVKGTFTGATEDKPGYFQAAEGGTILLDEIQSASLAVQAALLRVIDRKEIIPVGGRQATHVDVRVIATSNRDLELLASENAFRSDLYYRLLGRVITMPPLRDRRDDIALLAEHFLSSAACIRGGSVKRFSPRALESFCCYDWPGNVRELRCFVEQMANDCPRDIIRPTDIPTKYRKTFLEHGKLKTLADIEKAHVIHTLRLLNYNKVKVAQSLGISRGHLYQLMEKYSIGQCGETVPNTP